MLSAHQPYEHYPEIIRKACMKRMRLVRLRAVFRRCVMGHPGAGWNGIVAVKPRSDCDSAAVGLSHNMFDGALFLGVWTRLSQV